MANLHSKTIQISPKQLPTTVTPATGYDGLDCVEIISSFKTAWQSCSYDCYGPLEGAYGQDIPYIQFDGDFLAALGYNTDDEVRFTQWQFCYLIDINKFYPYSSDQSVPIADG